MVNLDIRLGLQALAARVPETKSGPNGSVSSAGRLVALHNSQSEAALYPERAISSVRGLD